MNNDGKIVKAEYIRKLEWENDILKVTDSIKSEMYNKIEEIILDHFEMDLNDLREYMSDKIKWEQKQKEILHKYHTDSEAIVHCAECRYLGFKDFSGVCKIDGLAGILRPEYYCSRGVRKE